MPSRLAALALVLAMTAVVSASCGTQTVVPTASPAASGPPGSGPTTEPSPTEGPTASPGPTDTPTPSPSPTPRPTPSPTPRPSAAPTATPPATGGALPACAYKDVLTTHRAYTDWERTLVDTIYRLPSTYAPSDLVDTSKAGLTSGYYVRSLAIADLTVMAADAKDDGAPLAIVSAYRSYATQVSTFQYWVNQVGYAQALLASARPGHSEHQMGTAIDFKSYGGAVPWTVADWAKTPAGAWMAANAWKYGWVMSYPAASSPSVTCYEYEPWHYRYVGRTTAAAIHDSGLPPRRWFWEHGAI
jgi:D-alanyl-D-alanine carboxypeptidase